MVTVYYAHCITTYDSLIESIDLRDLRNIGFDVINPNTQDVQESFSEYRKNNQESPMDFFKSLIDKCNCFAFRSLPDGNIPSGISFEINYAKSIGLPIIEMPSSVEKRMMDYKSTKSYLTEIGHYKNNI